MNFGFYHVSKNPEQPPSRTATIFEDHNHQSAARESTSQQMTPTPQSASASSSGHFSPDGQFRVVRKRNRVPLSCAPCRNRKLKCNRSQPCENCVKRGDALSCSYAAPGSRKKQSSSSQSSNSPDDMQNRIDRLEGLVLSLMTNGSQSEGPAAATQALSMHSDSASAEYPQDVDIDGVGDNNRVMRGEGSEESETDQVVQSLGVMRVDNNKSMYFGEAHWATILSDISEVKNYFAEHKKQYEEQIVKVQQAKNRFDGASQGPAFLFGGSPMPDIKELLAQLPKRAVTDRLISRYFNSYDPALHILHPPSWYRLFDKHWENPEKTEPVWLGQIFALLCLAMHSYYRMDDEPPEYRGKALALAANYRALTGQCLQLTDLSKPVNDTIETMVLYLHCEYARYRDADVGIWVLVGMIVRLAMRMGYHRDPKFYPNITPFQGETRRRVWTFLRQSDILFSFQIGLQSMIRTGDCDTELPRNLFDDEFDEDTPILPPARPATEPTPVSYMCAKASMAFEFGRVVERLHSTPNCSYDEIMNLDSNLRAALAELPPHLRMRSIEDSMVDPGALVMQRFNLSILYHKSQCVLHRKFLTRARENNRYVYSRRTCVDSSMELLSHQATLHYESRPGHQLYGIKVFVSSLTAADFLLATMIVALDLCYGAEAEGTGQSSGDLYTWGLERQADMIRAIEVANDIWKETKDQSMEAYKASELLKVILKKIKGNKSQGGNSTPGVFPYSGTENGQTFSNPGEEKPEHSAAMTLGMLSSGGMTPNPGAMFNGNFSPSGGENGINNIQGSSLAPGFPIEQPANGIFSAPSPLSFFGGVSSGMDVPPAVLDWNAWDSYIQDNSMSLPNQAQWPSSMDPALAAAGSDAQKSMSQQNFNSPGVFMGAAPGNMPL